MKRSKGKITVMITTAGRPMMLRTALRSVAEQTVLAEITEVIVSENGSDPASGTVCRDFPDLPISYRLRDPPIPREMHLDRVLSETYTPLVALLFDDDWWAADHLERSLSILDTNPEASACLGAVFYTTGERAPPVLANSYFFWLGANFPEYSGVWILDRSAMAVASVMNTPGTYSSLVAPTAIFHKAIKSIMPLGNPYDNDRMLFFELSRHGPVLYDPLPRVFIRMHNTAHQRSFSIVTRQRCLSMTTEWILDCCREEQIDLAAEFDRRDRNAPPGAWLCMRHVVEPWPWAVLKRQNILPPDWKIKSPLPNTLAGNIVWWYRRNRQLLANRLLKRKMC